FQAEDGIRDDLVTGVQTCALPIWSGRGDKPPGNCTSVNESFPGHGSILRPAIIHMPQTGMCWPHYENSCSFFGTVLQTLCHTSRSEERRVGKESISWWGTGWEEEM